MPSVLGYLRWVASVTAGGVPLVRVWWCLRFFERCRTTSFFWASGPRILAAGLGPGRTATALWRRCALRRAICARFTFNQPVSALFAEGIAIARNLARCFYTVKEPLMASAQ